MQQQTPDKKSIRPTISQALVRADMSAEERFQNKKILRPILKMQHELLLAFFRYHFSLKKDAFYAVSPEQRGAYIDKHILKDSKLRNALRGMIIGQFTVEEYKSYIQHSSALNRRMMQMVRERVLDGLID